MRQQSGGEWSDPRREADYLRMWIGNYDTIPESSRARLKKRPNAFLTTTRAARMAWVLCQICGWILVNLDSLLAAVDRHSRRAGHQIVFAVVNHKDSKKGDSDG